MDEIFLLNKTDVKLVISIYNKFMEYIGEISNVLSSIYNRIPVEYRNMFVDTLSSLTLFIERIYYTTDIVKKLLVITVSNPVSVKVEDSVEDGNLQRFLSETYWIIRNVLDSIHVRRETVREIEKYWREVLLYLFINTHVNYYSSLNKYIDELEKTIGENKEKYGEKPVFIELSREVVVTKEVISCSEASVFPILNNIHSLLKHEKNLDYFFEYIGKFIYTHTAGDLSWITIQSFLTTPIYVLEKRELSNIDEARSIIREDLYQLFDTLIDNMWTELEKICKISNKYLSKLVEKHVEFMKLIEKHKYMNNS